MKKVRGRGLHRSVGRTPLGGGERGTHIARRGVLIFGCIVALIVVTILSVAFSNIVGAR